MTTAVAHVHTWTLECPELDSPTVTGVCSCGAEREFAAWEPERSWNNSDGEARRLVCALDGCDVVFTTKHPRKRYHSAQCANLAKSRRRNARRRVKA